MNKLRQIRQLKKVLMIKTLCALVLASGVISSNWVLIDPFVYMAEVRAVTKRFELIALTRGLQAGIKEVKTSRLALTRYLCGKPLSGRVGVPICANGLPKILSREMRLHIARFEPDWIKVAIGILSITRAVKGGIPVDFSPIESPWTGSSVSLKDYEINQALRLMHFPFRPALPTPERLFQWVSTAGPNGVSISSSLKDLPQFLALYRKEAEKILPSIIPLLDLLSSWEEAPVWLSKSLGLEGFKTDSLRKISVKEDKEGKSRVFAIFDYWSQQVLTPLHDWMFDRLRALENDFTFNQHKGVEFLASINSEKFFYSLDLKSATDRFPLEFQKRVLTLLFGDEEYSQAWSDILTREPFRTKKGEPDIFWRTGQPLGAKSSWAVFTVCHHVILHIAMIRTSSKNHYAVLGDDVVIKGSAFAKEYRKIMGELGVEISESKTHVSRDTFEFAKVWWHRGLNVSGFPLSSIAELLYKPMELASFMVFEMPRKGYSLQLCPRSLSAMFIHSGKLIHQQHRMSIYLMNRCCWYISLFSSLSSSPEAHGWAKYLVQLCGISADQRQCFSLVNYLIRLSAAEAVEKGVNDLHKYAWKLVLKIPDPVLFADKKGIGMALIKMGESKPNVLQLAEHLLSIPIFAGLVDESEKELAVFKKIDLLNDGSLGLEQLRELKLPPKPQLKGFSAVRTKHYARSISVITNKFSEKVRLFFLNGPVLKEFKRPESGRVTNLLSLNTSTKYFRLIPLPRERWQSNI
jgi:hypothetical protein